MSHTFYDSPDDAPHPHISIDVTYAYAWFFQVTDKDGNALEHFPYAIVNKAELPAIHAALGAYLEVSA